MGNQKIVNPNILAKRYVTKAINDIFSEEGKVSLYRKLWVDVMVAQKKQGMDIPDNVINAYKKAINDIDFG